MRLNQDDIITLDETAGVDSLTQKLGDFLVNHQLRLTTAESCTGGKLASALCAAEDTPSFYGVGYITFTDEAKAKILHVQRSSLETHTAVSEAVVSEMAQGARALAEVDLSIAISGYGGPEGGEDGTPAGTVWFAWNINDSTFTTRQHFSGDCEQVLDQCVRFALAELYFLLTQKA
ncbi:2-oxo-tetronate isomerase [Salmonella enterica subsp. salamae]|nr:2-oxo-tetronate isomerase [Salmonella enterica subsp. salamae]ECJ2279970.1 2-oxo-tetronate isomerase [Salmonella enterica subsp. salamae]HCC0887022.1 2-oxo-tetronate isomerase [Salmonella enterica]